MLETDITTVIKSCELEKIGKKLTSPNDYTQTRTQQMNAQSDLRSVKVNFVDGVTFQHRTGFQFIW